MQFRFMSLMFMLVGSMLARVLVVMCVGTHAMDMSVHMLVDVFVHVHIT